MRDFEYCNPTRVVFGRQTVPRLGELVPPGSRVLLAYGGGAIKRNGVYDQVMAALASHAVIEFGGIQPNPEYDVCMNGARLGREERVDFTLAVGGGSVIDATKLIAAAIRWKGGEPWDFIQDRLGLDDAVPIGCVLTMPATGSEMNDTAVISRAAMGVKRSFRDPHLFPKFSILDPGVTSSLPERQVRNGIVDAFVHVVEQYVTWDQAAPLQDRQAESILLTLVEEGEKAVKSPSDYDARAALMWCATQALNGLIGCGVVSDFSTHLIGHELTTLYGVEHARTLPIVLPSLWRHQFARKRGKLARLGRRIWGLHGGDGRVARAAIRRTEGWFRSLGFATTLASGSIPSDAVGLVAARFAGRLIGEHHDIGPNEVAAILEMAEA